VKSSTGTKHGGHRAPAQVGSRRPVGTKSAEPKFGAVPETSDLKETGPA